MYDQVYHRNFIQLSIFRVLWGCMLVTQHISVQLYTSGGTSSPVYTHYSDRATVCAFGSVDVLSMCRFRHVHSQVCIIYDCECI